MAQAIGNPKKVFLVSVRKVEIRVIGCLLKLLAEVVRILFAFIAAPVQSEYRDDAQ